jgi:bifunctional DNA-binding transcriptional regulator/antitoxin component of YhaV-PrlF toxin-antitoxin module
MFGVYHYAVDQGRIRLPPRCRERFREGIGLYTVGTWLAGFPGVSGEAKVVSKLDARGRLAIPPELRSFAGIVDTVVVIASDDYIELWGERNWALELLETEVPTLKDGMTWASQRNLRASM